MKITMELIEAGKSERGGWTKQQLALLGVTWPKGKSPRHGWQQEIIGHEISEADAVEFVGIGPEPWLLKLQPDATPPPKPASRIAQLFTDGKSFSEVEQEIEYPE
jgi:hypothetical protein